MSVWELIANGHLFNQRYIHPTVDIDELQAESAVQSSMTGKRMQLGESIGAPSNSEMTKMHFRHGLSRSVKRKRSS